MAILFPEGLTQEEYAKKTQEIRNPFYEYPEDRNVLIWRYIDFTKLVALLDSSSLYFPNASLLGDSFEGSVSLQNLVHRQDELVKREIFFWENSKEQTNSTLEEFIRRGARIDAIAAHHLEWTKLWTYINCWHVNECESAAMWKLYGTSNQSVAIVSTFQRLLDSLAPHIAPPHGEPRIGLVRYLDYRSEVVPRNVHLSEFFCKRKSFAHERELRAVIQRLPIIVEPEATSHPYDTDKQPVAGISLEVELNQLIQAILVAPTAQDWFLSLVDNLCKKYRLTCEITRSEMDQSPVY